jgi:hypothetical protein
MNVQKHNISEKHLIFTPLFPDKYIGRYPIIARSSWELQVMMWLDRNEAISEWESESTAIIYFDPISQKNRRYYPDFTIRTKNNKTFIVEVKPKKETVPPKMGRGEKKTINFINENKKYKTNIAKWKAASAFAKRQGCEFKIWTEENIFR